ncbi:hypothetical protein HMPREF1603_04231, partial [Escherichia coli 907892]
MLSLFWRIRHSIRIPGTGCLYRTVPVLACFPAGLHRFNKQNLTESEGVVFRANNRSVIFRAGRHPAFCSAGG